VKIRHKALPADYYFYSDADADFNFTSTCTAVPLQEHEGTGNVVVTIAPIGNGRVRELQHGAGCTTPATDSIPEEPADTTVSAGRASDRPSHCNSQYMPLEYCCVLQGSAETLCDAACL